MEKPIIVVPYHNEPEQLRKQEEIWKNFDNRVIIIDDHSEIPVQTRYEAWRIDDNIPWNQPGAKNLGMYIAPDGWILLHDVDIYFPTMQEINEMEKVHGCAYIFRRKYFNGEPLKESVACMLLERSTFWNINGYCEQFSGNYGYDDINFYDRLLESHVRIIQSEIYCFSSHDDGDRGRIRDVVINYKLYQQRPKSESVLNFKYHKL